MLDLSKAFDSINHEILTHKLNLLGFSSSACNLINFFSDQRIQKTVVNNYESDWIELHQGVPQGTILGPLLFNLYINDLRTNIPENCEIIQYADDTMLFTADSNLDTACSNIEKGIEKTTEYFQSHFFEVNADKTDLLILNKPIHNTLTEKKSIKVSNESIIPSSNIKYLGVILDRNLTFQDEVKSILQKMAFGIKTINSIKNCLPINTRLLLMKAIIVTHIHYPAVLLSGISSSLLISLEKQLSWGVKICFNRRKYDRSSDLKFDHGILPVKFLLDQIAICFLWRIFHNMKPAYFSITYPTNSFCINKRTSLAF